MRLGVPYDSEEGRNIAGSITSLLTSTVYEASAEMAKNIGPFAEFEKNRDPMLNVIGMHLEASKRLNEKIKQSPLGRRSIPFLINALTDESKNVRWCSALALGKFKSEALKSIPALQKFLYDDDYDIRWAAYVAILKIDKIKKPPESKADKWFTGLID